MRWLMPKSFGLLKRKKKNENKTVDGRNTFNYFVFQITSFTDLR